MKRMLPLLIASFVFVTCASSDFDEPRQRRTARPVEAGSQSGLSIIPLTDWWREPALSSALSLSNDQYTSLDRIAAGQREEIARLERENLAAMRDLRQAFDANAAGITAAATRARSLRDTLFDRQVQMLAAERQVLTDQQWRTLQQEIESQRMDRRDEYGGRRGGGRARRPGRSGRSGW